MRLWYCFFFSSRRRHTRLQGDWSSDVCSSDLGEIEVAIRRQFDGLGDGLAEGDPAAQAGASLWSGGVFYGEIDLVDAGLVLDKGIADDKPACGAADAAELGCHEFTAFRREGVNGLAAVGDATDKEAAQKAGPGELQQPRVGPAG